jgi:3-oxoacid CoA-transferase
VDKACTDAPAALAGLLRDDMTIAAGGFGLCGIPENLIEAIRQSAIRGLTIIGNNAGTSDFGTGRWLVNGQVKKIIASYVGENRELERRVLEGSIELELVPQGTLAERIRAGGAGIPGFFTPTAVGTTLAAGKEVRVIGGRECVLETALRADLALVKAWRGDRSGNLVYRKTARNFNPLIATCGRMAVAEVEHLVETGEIDPDGIHTPGIYIHRLFQGARYEKRIEFRTVHTPSAPPPLSLERDWIVRRAAMELRDGDFVNLGIGLPTLVAGAKRPEVRVTFQSENGLLGLGPFPEEALVDADLINAGKQTVTAIPGAAFFSSADSFAMIRGGHVDLSILGAFEVSASGDIANWMVPGHMVKGPGGAMDLVAGAKRVVAVLEHSTREGGPRLLERCTLPITGRRVVDRVITDVGVFDVKPEGGFVLRELRPGITLEEARRRTPCGFDA